MEVIFSELAGNALRHARQPVRALLACTAEAWLISVQDGAPEDEPVVGSLGADQLGGRGLAMVLTLATSAGWYVQNGTKTVWAEVPDEPPAGLLRLLTTP